MISFFFLGMWMIPLIHGKYLLVDVDDQQPLVRGPELQCRMDVDGKTLSPWDSCNRCYCQKGCIGPCTKINCNDMNTKIKTDGQSCDAKRNNCVDGLKCVKYWDVCPQGNTRIGRCEKDRTVEPTVPDLKPPPRSKTCTPRGGRCASKLSITIEFSFRSSNNGEGCCRGLTCVLGRCVSVGWSPIGPWSDGPSKEEHKSGVEDAKCPWKDLDVKCIKECSGGFGVGANKKGEGVCQCKGDQCNEDPCKDCEAKALAKGKKEWACPCVDQ